MNKAAAPSLILNWWTEATACICQLQRPRKLRRRPICFSLISRPNSLIKTANRRNTTMNIDRRTVLAGILATVLAVPDAHAADRTPFDAAAFQAAQDAGKTVLLEVTAKWCGPCQRQRPVVAKLLKMRSSHALQSSMPTTICTRTNC